MEQFSLFDNSVNIDLKGLSRGSLNIMESKKEEIRLAKAGFMEGERLKCLTGQI